jgi:hypothetical protein
MPEAHARILTDRLYQHRAAVRELVEHSKRPLTVAEVRQLARKRNPTLSSVLLACAADDLRRQRKIQLAG